MPSHEKYLGINVYTDRATVFATGNFWDIRPFVLKGRTIKKYGDNSEYIKSIQNRVASENNLKNVLERIFSKKPLQVKHLKEASLVLKDPGGSCNLTRDDGRKKSVSKLTDIKIRATNIHKANQNQREALKKALSCQSAGCVAYQKEIFSLLGHFGKTLLYPRKSTGDEIKNYALNSVKERLKFQTIVPANLMTNQTNIEVLFTSGTYIAEQGNCARHVEILSGILFEAGNVYIGNFGPSGGDKKEPPVSLHNIRQIARIARQGHAITQNDWRNLMCALFATDVQLDNFTMKGTTYKNVYDHFQHDASTEKI